VLLQAVAAMKARSIRVPPDQRFQTGCIATLTNGTTTHVQHFTGVGPEAVRSVAAFCDRHGMRVVSLSTPETVYRDLQGSREVQSMRRGRVTGIEKPLAARVDVPERWMLGKIGRRELLQGWEARPKHG